MPPRNLWELLVNVKVQLQYCFTLCAFLEFAPGCWLESLGKQKAVSVEVSLGSDRAESSCRGKASGPVAEMLILQTAQ